MAPLALRCLSRGSTAFDNYIVDGIVNAVANITFWAGNQFRRIQTGNINGYLYGILLAVVVAIIVKLRYWS
jgi:NADH-quinone oxidoreductase subunit L